MKEFIRGFADVSANIRRSNRDINGLHRVYFDILNSNWKLPVQICNLLQEKLKIPVSEIIWGHPNLRDPKAKKLSGENFREHQLRVYAHEFIKIGFYIEHKQNILSMLAEENKNNKYYREGKFCLGYGRKRKKAKHPQENSSKLPRYIRGKHFDAYWQICAVCGCKLARNYIKSKSYAG